MNYLLEKNESQASFKMPTSMKLKLSKCAKKLKMRNSTYIKMAINAQIEKDLNQ